MCVSPQIGQVHLSLLLISPDSVLFVCLLFPVQGDLNFVCLSADWIGILKTPQLTSTLTKVQRYLYGTCVSVRRLDWYTCTPFSEFALESTGTFLAVPSVLLSANWTGSHYLLHCIPDPFPFFPPLFNFSLRRSLRYSPRHIYLYLFVLCQGLSPPFPSRSQIDRVWIGQESPRTLTSS